MTYHADQPASHAVDLTVNVHRGDAGFFEPTYRHVLGQFRYPFAARRIAIDRSVPEGRFVDSHAEGAIDGQLDALRRDGLVDVVDDVDWSPAAVSAVMRRYYGDPDAPTRCAAGTSIYQYLWALDQCTARYVIHLDSDILMHLRDGGAWIDEAIQLMRSHPEMVIATPEGGPPKAEGWRDWLLGPRRMRPDRERWQNTYSVSTRYFLVDRCRLLERACPLDLDRPGERLEESLTHTFERRGLERRSLADDANYVMHPRRHNVNHVKHLHGLIRLAESGRYPFRRTGYRWDIRTEGPHFVPWRMRLLNGAK